MRINKLFMKSLLGIVLAMALANSAEADTWTGYASGNTAGFEWNDLNGYFASGPITVALDITPFDTSLGTLNSVTMYAEVNASGSLQAWYYGLLADLTYDLSNTLEVAEMGNTVASVTGSQIIEGDPESFWVGSYLLPITANNYTETTITSGFGRFLDGPDPFQVFLTLTGSASSSEPLMTDVYFNFDGEARLVYDYDYTPVPEPSTFALLGLGMIGLAAWGRRK